MNGEQQEFKTPIKILKLPSFVIAEILLSLNATAKKTNNQELRAHYIKMIDDIEAQSKQKIPSTLRAKIGG